MTEELVTKNAAALVRMQRVRRRRLQPWTVEEVRVFLESARTEHDPMYAAYVLILVLGLRKGEVLGLTWPDVNFGANEVAIPHQLQRVGRQLHYRETKTEASEAILPLPDLCMTVLKERRADQLTDAEPFGDAWPRTTSCSPAGSAPRLIHVTSIAASPLDVPAQAYDPFAFMTRGTSARLCWLRSTLIPA
jgi:integrase